MNKSNQGSPQPVYTNNNGPTLEELELLLNRIEELDAKLDDKSIRSTNSKQAA